MADLALSCACGAIQGVVRDASPQTGTHAKCYCSSCRAGELHAGAADPAPEAVEIYQTSPHMLDITQGADKLAAFSFGPRNLIRWRAPCCNCTMFNTPRNPKMSFVGIRTNRLSDTDAIGPITGFAFKRLPNGKSQHKGLPRLLTSAVARIAGNRFSGRWRANPLFDVDSATPITDVVLVSWAGRRALLAAD